MNSATSRYRFTAPRSAGLAATLLVHGLLMLAWQLARPLPAQVAGDDAAMLWLRVPVPVPRTVVVPPIQREAAPAPRSSTPLRPMPAAQRQTPAQEPAPALLTALAPDAPPAPAEPVIPSTAAIMDSARRSIGDIDRALRKERQPTIVLPPDSPQIRLRRGIEHAREMAPPRLWEAPRVAELVNNTGDGARRTRVITANGTYCLTERAPTTDVEMFEKHGKQRYTTCPKDEEPVRQQEWRTARD
ncbi:hypothetical protein RCH14_003502 [Massilia sp. MP_M2]|uniref:hypothetical protein n=1 Tax=Massilia sp. MP_M2 TaxID=3071713 RepID=UPI00319E1936